MMKPKTSALLIRVILIGFALLGAAMIAVLASDAGKTVLRPFKPVPAFDYVYDAWMIFVCASLVPCYIVLLLGWLISNQLQRDNAFSKANSKLLKAVAILSAVDSVCFLCGTIYFFGKGLSGPMYFVSLIGVFIGFAVSVAAFVLSKLTARAADIQDENALTI